ncbi:hypothetical protein [Blautia sp. 1033sp1_1033st1_G9_1033SCRN_220408]|uniref:hypothetical protein n=1 Tax=Blautia sp. 1033sp1_1033st1_G9_1033SCRN_220408 TaxID=3144490 RepID=UPI0034A28486
MPTSTFDRPIIVSDPESVKKILDIMESDAPESTTPRPHITDEEWERGEELFRKRAERSRK